MSPNQPKLPNRFEVSFQNFRKFNWRERLKILCGFNAVVETTVRIDKRSGQTWQSSALTLTKEITADALVKDETERRKAQLE